MLVLFHIYYFSFVFILFFFVFQKRDKKFAVTGVLFPMISVITVIVVYYLLSPGDPELNPFLPRFLFYFFLYFSEINLYSSSQFVKDDNIYVPYIWENKTIGTGDSPDQLLESFTTYNQFPSFVPMSGILELNTFLLDASLGNITYGAYIFNHLDYNDGNYDVTIMYNQTADLSLPTFLRFLFV